MLENQSFLQKCTFDFSKKTHPKNRFSVGLFFAIKNKCKAEIFSFPKLVKEGKKGCIPLQILKKGNFYKILDFNCPVH